MKKLILITMAICLISFCAFAVESKDVQAEVLAKSTKSWNGDLMPRFPDGQPEVSILKITIQPGVKLPMHKHPLINAGVLLQGELTVYTKDGKILKMKAGDPIIEVVNKWHYGISGDKEPAVIIVFYAGTEGEKLSIAE